MPVEIPLTRGFVALIDTSDAERVLRHKWRAVPRKNGNIYALAVIGRRNVLMHRFILEFEPSDPDVDHRDHWGLNNQRENLRPATEGQNAVNRRPDAARRQNKYGVAGVMRNYKRWYGRVTKNGHCYITAGYKTAAEAGIARDQLAIELWGEFAQPLNEGAAP